MKVFAFSDIHVDINGVQEYDFGGKQLGFLKAFISYVNSLPKFDIMLCAGDVSNNLTHLVDSLKIISENVESSHFLFVPGNHDMWEIHTDGKPRDSKLRYEKILPEFIKDTGWTYLPHNPQIIDDCAFIGNIGWYDYSYKDPQYDTELEEKEIDYSFKTLPGTGMYMDVEFTHWGMEDEEVVSYLLNQLEADYEKVEGAKKKFAILHHIAFRKSILYKNDINWDFYRAFMGSSKFGDMFKKWNLDGVFYGHTHYNHTLNIDGLKVYCPSIGYYNEWDSLNLKKQFENRTLLLEI